MLRYLLLVLLIFACEDTVYEQDVDPTVEVKAQALFSADAEVTSVEQKIYYDMNTSNRVELQDLADAILLSELRKLEAHELQIEASELFEKLNNFLSSRRDSGWQPQELKYNVYLFLERTLESDLAINKEAENMTALSRTMALNSFAATKLLIYSAIKYYEKRDFDALNLVTIYSQGQVRAGLVKNELGQFTLYSMNPLEKQGHVRYENRTTKIDNARVVSASDFLLIQILKDKIEEPRKLASELVNSTHLKYKMNDIASDALSTKDTDALKFGKNPLMKGNLPMPERVREQDIKIAQGDEEQEVLVKLYSLIENPHEFVDEFLNAPLTIQKTEWFCSRVNESNGKVARKVTDIRDGYSIKINRLQISH
jgi:hypothetical protein